MTRSRRADGRPDVEALRDEIKQTRAELGETLQALVGRVDVPARVRRSAAGTAQRLGDSATATAQRLRGSASHTAVAMKGAVRDAGRRPVPWALVGLGAAAAAVAVVLVLRRRRR